MALLPQWQVSHFRVKNEKIPSVQAFQGGETAELLMPCNNQLDFFIFQDTSKTLSTVVKIILTFKYEIHSIYVTFLSHVQFLI